MKLLGIDDAGRGPVLGPMILAGILIEESEEQLIKNLGAKDSKLLTPKRRNEIKNQITKFPHHIEIATPQDIDNSSNLNYLEAIHTANIINTLTKNLNEKVKVIVDCPSTNIESWSNDVQKLLDKPEEIILSCEHKADYNHPIVSGASIIAKEKREEEMLRLRTELAKDFGSGYPADPKTKEFIRESFQDEKYKHIIRFSWNTVKKLVKEKEAKQKKLF